MLGKLVVGEIAVGEVVTWEIVLGKLGWGNDLTPGILYMQYLNHCKEQNLPKNTLVRYNLSYNVFKSLHYIFDIAYI